MWWLLAGLALLGIEVLSLDLLFASFALGAFVAAIAAALGAPVLVQVVVAAGVAIVTLFSLRPLALKVLRRGEPSATNVDALVGIGALVVERVDEHNGRVKLGGEVWSARTVRREDTFEPGTSLTVVRIDGATAIVDRTETS